MNQNVNVGPIALEWVDGTIDSILKYPFMWGHSSESIEMQVIMLCQFRALLTVTDLILNDERLVLNLHHDLYGNHMLSNNAAISPIADVMRVVESLQTLVAKVRSL